MTQVVYGLLADKLGHAQDEILDGHDTHGRPRLRTRSWSTPAAHVRREQAPTIPVDIDHGTRCGQLVHLEATGAGLFAVAEVADWVTPIVHVRVGDERVALETPFFWSASRLSTPDFDDVVIDSIALTSSPCRISAKPVTILPGGGLDYIGCTKRWSGQLERSARDLLEHAVRARRNRGPDDPIVVRDDTPLEIPWLRLREGDQAPRDLVSRELAHGLRRGQPGRILNVT